MRGTGLALTLSSIAMGAACVPESFFEMAITPSPIAVGARARVQFSAGSCRQGERGSWCDFDEVTIERVQFDPPGVFEEGPEGITAIAEGGTSLTVVAQAGGDSKTFAQYVSALPITRALAIPTRRGEPCELPALYAVGVDATVPFELWHDDRVLHGVGLVPFTVTGATLDVERTLDRDLVIRLPATPGAVATLSSPLDATAHTELETISPAAIDGITLGGTATTNVLGVAKLTIDVTSGGHQVCGDTISRTVTVTTPDTCRVTDDPQDGATLAYTKAGLTELVVRGYAAGACTLEVTLAGTDVRATRTITITR